MNNIQIHLTAAIEQLMQAKDLAGIAGYEDRVVEITGDAMRHETYALQALLELAGKARAS